MAGKRIVELTQEQIDFLSNSLDYAARADLLAADVCRRTCREVSLDRVGGYIPPPTAREGEK